MRPVNDAWRELEDELLRELLDEGFSRDSISVRQVAYIRYYGQLEDVEVESPVSVVDSSGDLEKLLSRFDELYTRMFTLAARPEAPTIQVTEVCVIASVETVKPRLRRKELRGARPPAQARKGRRPVFRSGRWSDADIWQMEALQPGNEIDGLAVIEASNTTLFVPPEWRVRIDDHEIYWLERKGAR